MAEIIYDDGADLSLIQSKKVAIIGYGSQGHAHALNLKDSGVDVVVGLRPGSSSWAKAEAAGLEVKDVAEAVAEGDVVSVLLPDQVQRYVYAEQIAPNLKEGAALLYVQGKGTPDVVAVEVDASGKAWELALSYAKGIGGTRAGVIKTTFTEETETDLFGEQAVLCGGVSHLIQAGFETLVEAGYQPEIAYFEVCHEMKQIVDLINEGGITKQRWSCSDTAEYGDYVSGPRVIGESSKEAMKAVLADIQDGTFARKFIADQDNGALEFKALRAEEEAHPIEKTGQKLRKAFGWTDSDEDYTEGSAAR